MIDRYSALAAFLHERNATPFAWGKNDCCVFAADAVRAQTGRDPMADWREQYDNERSASALLLTAGGIARMTTEALGIPRPLVTTAQRGDVVLFESGAGPALGVCVGANFAAVRPAGGLGYFSMRHAVTVWKVE